MAERGTDRPTEAEVRGLMAEYSEPAAPECNRCSGQTSHTIDCTGISYFRCKWCGNDMQIENKYDPDVIAVCEDWLRLRATETPWTQNPPTDTPAGEPTKGTP